MKQITTTLLLSACLSILMAQELQMDQWLKRSETQTIAQLDLSQLSPQQLFVRMPYAMRHFVNFPGGHVFRGLALERVDIVYTDYPQRNGRRQQALNRARIRELARRLPEIWELPEAARGVIIQNNCPTEATARTLPHGFLLTFSEPHELPDFTRTEQLAELMEEDSTVLNALNRNPNWKKMLVVTDLTGSMSPYTAQLLLWFKLAENTGKVEHLIFFNDGDDKPDSLKTIGTTGGVYSLQPQTFEQIAQLANEVVIRGNGGDEPENNIEALLQGLKQCPHCDEVIMIADNWATPRDIELAHLLKRPVRIILCGTEEGINTAYLNLARQTGGSLHTIEEDLYDLLEMNEGQEIQIGREVFTIRNGRFELSKRI
ncbi:MAG TPA: hypothetical protein PKC76_13925 [Saprospiraceae bacterium]|nr:hypothetical protein [Saprospiraceae bacterium]HMP25234.1 hypothetical protein [Saprospiraceae bacterium]